MAKKNYLAILKGKEGEYFSLAELSKECKSSFTPLIEAVPFPDNEYEKHLKNRVIKCIIDKWGSEDDIFIDFKLLNNDIVVSDNTHPLKYVFDTFREHQIKAIPVTGLSRNYQNDIKNIIQTDNKGICLRLQNTDWNNPNLPNQISLLLDNLSLAEKDVDLLIDLRDMLANQIELLAYAIVNLVNSTIPNIMDWRSLTLAGSSFPYNLSDVLSNSETMLPRGEWLLWNKLSENKNNIKRLPDYGDYSIAHPELPPKMEPTKMNMSANIRYTTDNNWLVMKGKGVKQNGFNQFHVLSRVLTERDEYSGRDFSWGDDYIYKCARNEVGTGNATTWRKVGNSRHITFVTHQLSNYPGL